jgi:hypothetical protein
MKILLSLFFCTVISFMSKGQSSVTTTLSGMALLSTSGESAYLTMGGPGIKVTHGAWQGGIYMLPSLRYKQDAAAPDVTPLLGSGIIIGYKRLLIGIPLYYLAATKKWEAAFGLGFRLGK